MIRSDIAAPMPGSEESVFASCSSMAVATSRTGRTIALRALRTPTPSTEQKSSKNSRSTSLMKPISRGVKRPCAGFPSRYWIVCRLISWPISCCKFRRVNSGMRISYSSASILSESVLSCRATSWPVILVIMSYER